MPLKSMEWIQNLKQAAHDISNGAIIGWFQGGSEIGPRALGHRSILADPRDFDMKGKINHIKQREEWRPYAPAVIEEEASKWFDIPDLLITNTIAGHMMLNCNVLDSKREEVPAITHVDGSSRPQLVPANEWPFYDLIDCFYLLTDVPLLLNTSFNIQGQPIVETPKDALRVFESTSLDGLVMDKYYLVKEGEYAVDMAFNITMGLQ